METFKDCIKNIRSARLGKEAREPIAAALEEIENNINNAGNNIQEVNDARGNFDTLEQRMASMSETIDAYKYKASLISNI